MKTAGTSDRRDGEPKNLSVPHAIGPYRLVEMMMCKDSDLVWSQAQTYRAADALCEAGGVLRLLAGARDAGLGRAGVKVEGMIPVLHEFFPQAGSHIEESETPA